MLVNSTLKPQQLGIWGHLRLVLARGNWSFSKLPYPWSIGHSFEFAVLGIFSWCLPRSSTKWPMNREYLGVVSSNGGRQWCRYVADSLRRLRGPCTLGGVESFLHIVAVFAVFALTPTTLSAWNSFCLFHVLNGISQHSISNWISTWLFQLLDAYFCIWAFASG